MPPRLRNWLLTGTALMALGLAPAASQPVGGVVSGGSATISGQGTSSLIVNQSSDRAIINWQQFNISTGGSATFHQPTSSSITLNRVTGGYGPSTIDGTITGNGRVFIINRDGILFGRNAVVNTAGFLATTNDIRDDDFMAGRMNFNIRGRPDASIVNLGTINATNRGFAALVAPGVRNSGTISARLGTVALAAGNSFTLDMYGDRLIQLAVGDEIASKVIDVATGKPLTSLVSNEGTIRANGGRVELTAAAARAVVDSVINNRGVIEANSVGRRNGKIVLGGSTGGKGLPKQTIKVAGKITATGKRKGQTGGTIQISGQDIAFAAAMLDVSGHSGGGKILVGGDYGGGRAIPGGVDNPSATLENYAIPTATTVTVDGSTTFNASATGSGHGGKVILWSDSVTSFAGTIYARGGEQSGDGGFVEVSGKQQLVYTGLTNTLAPAGRAGTLLLDPADYYLIEDDAPAPPAGASVMTRSTLEGQLAGGNVLIKTDNEASFDGQHGDIFVKTSIEWSAGHNLTLSAYRNIDIASGVVIRNEGSGSLVLRSDNTGLGSAGGTFGGEVRFCQVSTCSQFSPGTGLIDFSDSTGKVSIFYNPFQLYSAPYSYAGNVSTNPLVTKQFTDYMLVNNVNSLQDISQNLAGNYALGRDIDASATVTWNSGRGFVPLGGGSSPFSGNFDGLGHTITNLKIAPNDETTQSTGLFSVLAGGSSVSNLNLANAAVSANPGFVSTDFSQWVGIVAGQSGGTITNVHVSGAVSGLTQAGVVAGGLVGQHGILGPSVGVAGSITNSSADVGVAVAGGDPCPGTCRFNIAGGLVGANVAGSTITSSSASGDVTGGAFTFAGGLVGQNGFIAPTNSPGFILNSSATGNVTVSGNQSSAGGLVGQNSPGSTITDSQAFGVVTATFNGTGEPNEHSSAGGLVGSSGGVVMSMNVPVAASSACTAGAAFSCATGNVSVGATGSAGGLVGFNFGTISHAFATGLVTGADGPDNENATHLGGLAGHNRGTITASFARGNVGSVTSDFTVAGGLVGDNTGTITNSSASGTVTVGNTSLAGGLAGNNSSEGGDLGNGVGENNDALISGSSASGAVSVGNQSFGGGFVAGNIGTINTSSATGAVTGRALAMVGGFAAASGGTIATSNATGNVTTAEGFAGGFIGFNFGTITRSFATGNVSSTGLGFVGGFAGMNTGLINEAYARGAVSGGSGSFLGGFVGLNADGDLLFEGIGGFTPPREQGSITQSYAFGPVTGSNAVVAGGFAALNIGALDEVYGVGRVQGGTGSTLGGLVGSNNLAVVLPDMGLPTNVDLPAGTATNSFWDMQTTAMTTSAGGTGMNTAVLAGGLPPGFNPAVWSHGSYPFLINLGPQNTNPLPPVIPPVGSDNPVLPPLEQQVNQNASVDGNSNLNATVNTPQMVQDLQQQQGQQQQQQNQQQQQAQGPVGGTGLPAPQPIRLDVGDENRHFYLPPPGETRLVANEVVLQMPCDVPQAELDAILKQHNLTVLASQCLQAGGNAAFRMRHASSQAVAAVIRALAAHRIIAAAQANYSYTLAEAMDPKLAASRLAALTGRGDPGQYITEKLRLAELHKLARGNGVSVAVIDSEIDAAHPDLNGTVINRYDATGVQEPPHSHGTGMAGAITSGLKLLGVAPGAQIFAIRAFSVRAANTESTTYNILRGIDWAVNNNVRIINMSFAGPRDPSLERALKQAYDKGVILVAAAGNAGMRSPPLYPAADPHVIAVTATDADDRLFTGANRGTYLTIAAPGVDILAPAPGGQYQVTTGTSIATAHVSGVVALMLERNPKLGPADVRKILMGTARRLGPTNQFGAGLVDPARALEAATPRSAAAPAPKRR